MLSLLLCALIAAPDAPASLLLNGGFERSRGWQLHQATLVADGDRPHCLRVDGAGSAIQDVPVGQGEVYSVAVDVRTEGVRPTAAAGYAYVAVYQLDGSGALVRHQDFRQLVGDNPWQRYAATIQRHPDARVLSVRCGLYQAAGVAWFDDWTLVPGDRPMAYDEVQHPGAARAGAPRAAILDLPDLPVRGARSSPEVLATILAGAGYRVDRLDERGFADPEVLRPEVYTLAVVPTGASFPAVARDNWIQYLHRGGSFVSTGGYAFADLYVREGERWIPEAEQLRRAMEVATSAERSLLPNGGFEQDVEAPMGGESLDGAWRRNDEGCTIAAEDAPEGRRCARVHAPAGREVNEVKFWLDLPVRRGSLRVSARLRTADVVGSGFAYVALYQYAQDGQLLKWRDFVQVRGDSDWQTAGYDFTPEPGTARLHIKFGLYQATGTAWFDDIRLNEITGLAPRPLNTATGTPGDGLGVAVSQIGAFDPSVPLKRAVRLVSAGGPLAAAAPTLDGPFEGWVATGVCGWDNARWIPLLEATDRYGRPRGAAAALLAHYAGFYGGSFWAYFGVENRDLFPSPDAPTAALLAEIARFIARGVHLRNLRCELPLYEPGEPVDVSVVVEGPGELPNDARIRFDVAEPKLSREVPVAGIAPVTARASLPAPAVGPDLVRVRATLVIDGQDIDTMTTGFVVRRPEIVARGPRLRFVGNVFECDGRALFLFGSDTFSYSYHSAHENPVTWDDEHRACVDYGLNLYENLQYGRPDNAMRPEDWRAFAAMAQSTQRHRLVFMPGMLIGFNVVAGDDELASQSRLCAGYAEHLGHVPGLLYYINGDYQLDPGKDPAVTRELWTRWLLERHGSIEGIERVWGEGRVAREGEQIAWPPRGNRRWDDPAEVDAWAFRQWLMRRWNEAHVRAVREQDTDHPITSEYYSVPFGGIDLRLTIDGQDVSNIGFFDEPETDIDVLPLRLAWNDLRAEGKGVSLGEYGVKTHPAWSVDNGARGYHIVRTEEQQDQLFLAVAAYTMGMGGSKVQNWCLKDAQEWVFPWGLFYPNQMIPKDVAYVHRNISLLWRQIEPRDEAPALTVVLPSLMRTGNGEVQGRELGYRCFETLLGLHVPFNVIDDAHLAALPPSTTAAILPCPVALADETFERLRGWVEAGGRLLLTGDLSCDDYRRPTRAERLETLCGVKLVERLAAPGSRPDGGPEPRPCVRVEATAAEVVERSGELPLVVHRRLGRGEVFYCTDPVELTPVGTDATRLRALYRRFLRQAGIASLPVEPDSPGLHVFARPTRTGRLLVAFDREKAAGRGEVTVATAAGSLKLGQRRRWPAAALIADEGRVPLVLTDGFAAVKDQALLNGTGLQGAVALDGQDLRRSEQVLITPFGVGRITLPARRGAFSLLVGDLRDGAFVPFEHERLAGDSLTFEIDQDRRYCLFLLARQGAEAVAMVRLEESVQRPWVEPGY